MRRKIILDVDTGIDDALALLLAARSPELDLIGVTCVAGNVTLDHVVRNTLSVLDLVGSAAPVFVGARKPLASRLRTATLFHGENGLGGVAVPSSRRQPEGEDAASFLCRVAAEQQGEITLVAVGPLTNVALAILRDGSFARNLGGLIIMGGAVHVEGNVNGVAEANFANDPEAAATVAASIPGLTLVDLGATTRATLPLARLGDPSVPDRSAYGAFAIRILQFYGQAYLRSGAAGPVLHDPLAVGLAAVPELARLVPVHLEVETRGLLTRGASIASTAPDVNVVADLGEHLDVVGRQAQERHALLARDVDTDRFLNTIIERLDIG